MQKLSVLLLFLVVVSSTSAPNKDKKKSLVTESSIMKPQIEKKIEALLSETTMQGKIGQMVLDSFTKRENHYSFLQRQELDSALVHKAIHIYKLGSILKTSGILLSGDDWCKTLKRIQGETVKTLRSVPIRCYIDAIHEVNYIVGETPLFSQQIGLAATFDIDIVRKGQRFLPMKPEHPLFREIFLLS
ncbi:hypothetical protein [Aquimarina sp. RZ0]|uniref:hypothetical protein n=1 Tax=Aquimarina sp. RZ0 TaxID=2607730 RepID=UPI0011F33204|nr:hypothetical protein [Aquimarina sp. RZ0]KAA1244100.1 hypothetical protein F0000_18080 [Aquimarina sp. RZ0]